MTMEYRREKLQEQVEHLKGATSTYFDEDEGMVTKKFREGDYRTRRFEVFGGWQCYQLRCEGAWYDIDQR